MTGITSLRPARMTVNHAGLARDHPLGDDPGDVVGARHRDPVDRDDRVAADRHPLVLPDDAPVTRLEARPLAAGPPLATESMIAPCAGGVAEGLRDRRRQVLGLEAEVGVVDVTGAEQLLERALHRVDRDGEGDALEPGLEARADLGVDPDRPAGGVEKRAAGVALVDRRVGLDRVEEVVGGRERRDRPADAGDDPDRERGLGAERRADRRDRLSDRQAGRRPERDRHERDAPGRHPQHSDVVVRDPSRRPPP